MEAVDFSTIIRHHNLLCVITNFCCRRATLHVVKTVRHFNYKRNEDVVSASAIIF